MRDPEEAYRQGFEHGMEFALYEVGAGRSDRDIREWLDRQLVRPLACGAQRHM